MSFQVNEQIHHDRINVFRLVRRLERTIATENWNGDNPPSRATWIKTQRVLQTLKHARKLLDTVELHESDQQAFQRYDELRATIARLCNVVKEVEQRAAPVPSRPAPALPALPLPRTAMPTSPLSIRIFQDTFGEPSKISSSLGDVSTSATQDQLFSPSVTTALLGSEPASATLLPADPPSTSKPAPTFLQNSSALQEELSEQLAQMATQLKRNTQRFSDALEKDKTVVQETQEKLERNHDVMSKERVRVRDHHSKSWGTTWLVILSLVVALVGFMLTFFVIRFT